MSKILNLISNLKDFPPLLFRLILAYGFLYPALAKVNNISAIAEWFAGMNIPFPLLNAYLATTTEISGVILLTLGLATRLISIPLMFTMFVAIFTVHFQHGFEAGKNGFEIPLYYLLMLFSLLISGPGRLSLDYLIFKKFQLNSCGK